jgi:hypothetical protein
LVLDWRSPQKTGLNYSMVEATEGWGKLAARVLKRKDKEVRVRVHPCVQGRILNKIKGACVCGTLEET